MPHPFPNLQVWDNSNLSFPWAEVSGHGLSVSDAHLGPEGVGGGTQIYVFWEHLERALQEIIGYSWRDTSGGTPGILRRNLPWQHPFFYTLFCKAVTSVKGVRMEGTNISDPEDLFINAGAGLGKGLTSNYGPWTEYRLAVLTVQFWRPPYYVRSDADILDADRNPQEWLRYVDREWQTNSSLLSREDSAFIYIPGQGLSNTNPIIGGVGQVVAHDKISRTWYEIPEAAIFTTAQDGTPAGIAKIFAKTQTATVNPYTRSVYASGNPLAGCLNYPIGGPTNTADPAVQGTVPFVLDNDDTKKIFGCDMGTLRFEGAEIRPMPLQLPGYLMQIPLFGINQLISQVQYNVTLHFDRFDPIPGNAIFRGHNLLPWAGNGLWWPAVSQKAADGVGTDGNGTPSDVYGIHGAPNYSHPPTTPFQYADFRNLFTIL